MVLASLLCIGCSTLPERADTAHSTRFTDTGSTRLGMALADIVRAHDGLSGIHPLTDGHDAFAARALMAFEAERSIDAQYYIWRDDTSGRLLLQALRQAADRGVRVRLLLDDNNTAAMDPVLKGLDEHPMIDVRLFNPFLLRSFRSMGFVADFSRLNRRMHNKSFTVDNQITIVGGRNIGNEYFDAGDGVMFVDLDVIAVGTIVDQVSTDFDRYWASASSYPLRQIISPQTISIDVGVQPGTDSSTQNYLQVLRRSMLNKQVQGQTMSFEWAATRLLSDNPDKGLGTESLDQLLIGRLDDWMGRAQRHLTIVSPYFVPTSIGADSLMRLARRGVEVTVVTNALSATDVTVVHSGYVKYRKPLLKAGVKLFELKPDATIVVRRRERLSGSSSASLHAKTIEVDGKQLFVGSFNMDPRSIALNTEMGILIDSPALARQLHQSLGSDRIDAYELSLDGSRIRWSTIENGREVIYTEEPNTTWWKRFGVGFMSLLPIEWLL
ncbi:MAG: phospholipase D family protein [Lautropia sp.]|nr:phospholipase D family protein [Lautropia sp.]